MTGPITPIRPIASIPLPERITRTPSDPGAFQSILNESVQAV